MKNADCFLGGGTEKLKTLLLVLVMVCLSCSAGEGGVSEEPKAGSVFETVSAGDSGMGTALGAISLEELAEIERSGGYFQNLALTESIIRENAGDYGGAAVAAYKELSWAYGYGAASADTVRAGLKKALNLFEEETFFPGEDSRKREEAVEAIKGIFAFLEGRWTDAGNYLKAIAAAGEEPDGFVRWMLLVCALEGGENSRTTRSAYGSIRARYVSFPEYWYRGARCFSGNIALEYAERCVNLAARGPFAAECRGIIAENIGLSPSDAQAVRSKAEIENIIKQAAAAEDPAVAADLFPLISLPDNAYTLYALGALRSLASVPKFKDYFAERGAQSAGRLAERLIYVSRG
jgi:hypothetical protein